MVSIKEQINELRKMTRVLPPLNLRVENKEEDFVENEAPIDRINRDLYEKFKVATIIEECNAKKAGRPKNKIGLASRKFSVRLVSRLDRYFLKLKGWKNQDLGKDSKRLKFLLIEHQIWERVIGNYCTSMRRYIGHIESELVSIDIKAQTRSKMNDVYLLFGLYQIPLEDHSRYFNEKELNIIRLCINYSNNRKN